MPGILLGLKALLILAAIGAAVYLIRRARRQTDEQNEQLPAATYVCDECGERDCICHREDSERS
ncbi:MAG: hypothetical protein ACLFOY_08475 [Desulfatibacillaceae bacterium]